MKIYNRAFNLKNLVLNNIGSYCKRANLNDSKYAGLNKEKVKTLAKNRWNLVSNSLDDAAKYIKDPKLRTAFNSDNAKHQIYRTLYKENYLDRNARTQTGGGPAVGVMQIEPVTHMDFVRKLNTDKRYGDILNYLKTKYITKDVQTKLPTYNAQRTAYINGIKNKATRETLNKFYSNKNITDIPYQLLNDNDDLSVIMARMRYLAAPEAIPSSKDYKRQSDYWFKYYNRGNKDTKEKKMKDFDNKHKILKDLGDPHASTSTHNRSQYYPYGVA